MVKPILKAVKMTKEFPGVLVLDEVDFDLFPGEVHVRLGENGAGKSTFIKLLSGVYPKDSGRFLSMRKKSKLSQFSIPSGLEYQRSTRR